MVQTVLGPIQSQQLGFTLMHEHFCIRDPAMTLAFIDRFDRQMYLAEAVRVVKDLMSLGVQTIVDATPIDLGRDAALLKEISYRTGLNIIASTGFYHNEKPWFEYGLDVDFLVDLLYREIEVGMQNTSARAGVIKIATDVLGLTPTNTKLLTMAAKLSKKSGLPIITHAYAPSQNGLQQVDLLICEGVNPCKIMIGHSDDNEKIEYHLELAKRGCYIGIDRMVINWMKRTRLVSRLCQKGLANQIMLSHDCELYSEFGRIGYNNQYRYQNENRNWCIIPTKVVPRLLLEGASADDVRQMTVKNPQMFFTA